MRAILSACVAFAALALLASCSAGSDAAATAPTASPAAADVATSAPAPTATPVPEPTVAPTAEPTDVPTPQPTEEPTAVPTEVPTPEPTEVPEASEEDVIEDTEPSEDPQDSAEDPAVDESGEQTRVTGAGVFSANCATCHGANGTGTGQGPALTGIGQFFTADASPVVALVTNGGTRMPEFGSKLSTEEIALVVQYVVANYQ